MSNIYQENFLQKQSTAKNGEAAAGGVLQEKVFLEIL